jgi:cardiolipin synthase
MIIWGIFDGWVSTIVSSVFLLAVVATIIVVVLENRNPVKTLAWVLVLSFLPVVGLVLYFFFGREGGIWNTIVLFPSSRKQHATGMLY